MNIGERYARGCWIIEVGVDDEADSGHVMDIPATGGRDSALALARMTRGRTMAELREWASADQFSPLNTEDEPVASASVVYYDGNENLHETRTRIKF